MLELRQITKDYLTGDSKVHALRGIDLKFRENEFVSILGQSGCGKTTLLNIIGGLDQYTSGDLIINGKSTKNFRDRDWDTYRNHTIGFVFQSYNLISHQTVLANVELAMTLSGVSREERRRRAAEALEKVGLGDQMKKKPNQLSGGQMQRVAIARALVNNPDILLADEPTGALDSATSVQIMDLLKEVARDRLVIMVTHNPALAEKYSTRIIKLMDGQVTDDSNPYEPDLRAASPEAGKTKERKPSMSFVTALSLSLTNLMTKKGRTFMIAFAGSIGIIGIALILSLSNGAQNYINQVEEDTLTSYPLTIQSTAMDMTSLMSTVMGTQDEAGEHGLDKVYSNNIMNNVLDVMAQEITTNDLTAFKEYLESGETNIGDLVSDIQYTYDTPLNIYKSDTSGGVVQLNPTSVMETMGMSGGESTESTAMASQSDVWNQLVGDQELISGQYDVVAGRLAEAFNEVVLITDENNEVTDYTLYSLGLMDKEELSQAGQALMRGEEVLLDTEQQSYTFDEILSLTFKLVASTDYYQKENGVWTDMRNDEDFMENLVNEAQEIRIVGILRPSGELATSGSGGTIGYLPELMTWLVNRVNESEIVKEQTENPDINVFTGAPFENGEETDLQTMMENMPQEQQAYLASLDEEERMAYLTQYSQEASATYEENLTELGIADLDTPSQIDIYPKDFESKEQITDLIDAYNQDAMDAGQENLVIQYTDMIGMMMSSVTTIINAISAILIAFVAISLIVSSIMIGIITYISVLERTKEIGILRSIGASKKDISRVFNAETVIVGVAAGALGIAVTELLNMLINLLVERGLDISNIAQLPPAAGVILVAISMILTLIAGLIPSRLAAKRDPVKALRTE
ncbi:MAG TPA: ABC transporter ATP-binding protein/permease [Candidatus Limivivens intestinipullorum]|uniref:ABC transporter ATP-binding protein/permease n=1 Tax=Candidatus Limivivens intestinipullorum TaxID=2840858 RepID=A0A9D1ESQ5_9FIRM|nr:ABC transporter ATP-binding protein/permease [Candidatus Limivivens intestinipullorum]